MYKLCFNRSVSAAALAVLVCCASAHAQLGGTMPSGAVAGASAPRTVLNGALRERTWTDAGNTVINEYATSTGQIVAYAWQGPTMPDLHALLGKYADSYQAGAAAAAGSGNLHASRVARSDVIVESGGPMRGYVGRAWLPAALPAGVTSDDIQ
ncbi:hypothetical protein BTH42_17170 [Burkholderia sp. SRS-W-2-2016]|uniref:DUF2844 domain-containing protein n=1 Tax=Burkholderia sp. SRS-W-2-2016 TaxID=1926878 RepID=UPI00094B24AF|nr:DUF2844 domain-containing protein [Burkholderia sp. SRS-W-2-2016]OLL30480.1 hypothetical protein BTH42_17170 [Burkholderia sp. SRS-W-2-2016]